MALQTDVQYAQLLVDTMKTASPDFLAQGADVHDSVRDVLGLAIATVVLQALADGRVAFSAGGISGSDSGGDTHGGLSASGGVIA